MKRTSLKGEKNWVLEKRSTGRRERRSRHADGREDAILRMTRHGDTLDANYDGFGSLWIRSVIESLSRAGIKRSARARHPSVARARLVYSFLFGESTMDDVTATGWQIIFRGAKTCQPADPGWHLNIRGSESRTRRERDITAKIFIKLPRIWASIYFRRNSLGPRIKLNGMCNGVRDIARLWSFPRRAYALWVCGRLWNAPSIFLTALSARGPRI